MSEPLNLSQKLHIAGLFRGEDDSTALLESAARQHAEGSDQPDHEVGDLQVYLRKALALMTPDQRVNFYADGEVRETLATGLGVERIDLGW